MYLKVIALGMLLLSSAIGWAQQDSLPPPPKPAFSLGGSVDFYYKQGLGKADKGLTSFTQSDRQFQLGMASLQLKYEQPKTDIVIDLGFGQRARDFSYADHGAMTAIKQAYIDYKPVEGLVLTAGTWATHIGYEVLDASANQNYSMSYMFSTGPFSNTGFKAAYHWKQHQLMIGVSNPTDYRSVDDSLLNRKFIIAQYLFNNDKGFSFALNYTGGKWVDTSKIQQLDGVLNAQVTSGFSIGLNGTVGIKKLWQRPTWSDSKIWWGAATYLKGSFSKDFDLGLREEYFVDKHSITGAALGGNVWSSTLTAAYKVGELKIMPEFRIDKASEAVFTNQKKTNAYFLLATVYQF